MKRKSRIELQRALTLALRAQKQMAATADAAAESLWRLEAALYQAAKDTNNETLKAYLLAVKQHIETNDAELYGARMRRDGELIALAEVMGQR